MANQILSIIQHRSLHTTLKTESNTEIQKATWAAAAAKTISVYNEVLKK
jgi:hypothetical protein